MTRSNRYRKKPVEVNAMLFELGWTTKGDILDFCPTANVGVPMTASGLFGMESVDIRWVVIRTLEGDMNVSDGDYIICGVKGEFYPCKPDVFELTYEKVQ